MFALKNSYRIKCPRILSLKFPISALKNDLFTKSKNVLNLSELHCINVVK